MLEAVHPQADAHLPASPQPTDAAAGSTGIPPAAWPSTSMDSVPGTVSGAAAVNGMPSTATTDDRSGPGGHHGPTVAATVASAVTYKGAPVEPVHAPKVHQLAAAANNATDMPELLATEQPRLDLALAAKAKLVPAIFLSIDIALPLFGLITGFLWMR